LNNRLSDNTGKVLVERFVEKLAEIDEYDL